MSMYKKILRTTLKSALICAAIAFGAAAQGGGIPTDILPPPDVRPGIQIYTFDDLCKIGNEEGYPINGVYRLMNDIDASASRTMNGGKGFEPIGRSETMFNDFQGVFNGNGYSIRGLYINRPNEETVGLFSGLYYCAGVMSSESVACPRVALPLTQIYDLVIEADSIVGGNHVGILAGTNYGGAITNCKVSGTVIATGADVGGLVGRNYGKITGSRSTANVFSTDRYKNAAGGCGGSYDYPLRKTNCIGDFPYAYAGGLVGYNIGTIDKSHAAGDVSAFKSGVGGLAGINFGGISHSYATGKVSVGEGGEAGGLVGFNEKGGIYQSYATGTVSAAGSNVGGLVGWNKLADIINCYAKGDARGYNNIGGLVGVFAIDDDDVSKDGEIGSGGSGSGSSSGGTVGGGVTVLGKKSDAVIGAPYRDGPLPGLVGLIGHCFAAGIASSTRTDARYPPPNVGGLIGLNTTEGRVYSSYYSGPSNAMHEPFPDEHGRIWWEMTYSSTFKDWDFEGVWKIDENESYPYFRYQSEEATSISHNTRAARNNRANSSMPRISVKGRTLNVKLPSAQSPSSDLMIRVIDMRGRTVHSGVVNNSASTLSLTKIPAGRYIIEVKNSGMRVGSAPVVVR